MDEEGDVDRAAHWDLAAADAAYKAQVTACNLPQSDMHLICARFEHSPTSRKTCRAVVSARVTLQSAAFGVCRIAVCCAFTAFNTRLLVWPSQIRHMQTTYHMGSYP